MHVLRLVPYAVLLALVGLCLWLFYFVGTDHPHRADAIVVLAGDPGDRRLDKGLELFREGVAPVLAVSIDSHTTFHDVPACARRRVVCFHATPYSTRGEAETFSRMARRRDWRSIVIVSSRFHLRRARMLFARCTNASLQIVPARTTLWQYARNISIELAKLLVQVTIVRGC